MYIIIDACNVLRSGGDSNSPITPRKRDFFLTELQRYSKEKKHEIVVVFDGGFGSRPGHVRAGKIIVWDAGMNDSADDVIYDLLDDVAFPFEALLVSSDRELTNYAEDCNIVSIDAPLFHVLLRQATQATKHRAKVEQGYVCFGPDRPELDELMRAGSKKILDKDSKNVETEQAIDHFLLRSSKKGTKLERRLMRILEKL